MPKSWILRYSVLKLTPSSPAANALLPRCLAAKRSLGLEADRPDVSTLSPCRCRKTLWSAVSQVGPAPRTVSRCE